MIGRLVIAPLLVALLLAGCGQRSTSAGPGAATVTAPPATATTAGPSATARSALPNATATATAKPSTTGTGAPVAPIADVVSPPLPTTLAGRPVVYLTYDDGPNNASTRAVLAQLKQYRAVATFFVIGYNVRKYPAVLRAELGARGSIGNHTLSHRALTSLDDNHVLIQLRANQRLIKDATGVTPTCFRPPYGATSPHVRTLAARLGLEQQLWNNDWTGGSERVSRNLGAKGAAANVLRHVRPGSVILMHDAPVRQGTKAAAITAIVLPTLLKRGYRTALLCRNA